ncbi:MAG TPA: C1 family peptidase [Azospirillaceae bacterium]|nr:C1 family peptidase [Azospirillaceae bacterium]
MGSTDLPMVGQRACGAMPDLIDFRDRMFEPTLVDVPAERPLSAWKEHGIPVLDQGIEGACTGFGLATVVHYLQRTRKVGASKDLVSPRMLYEMAKRYDEWPGEDYSGSSARGAMKAWHKHGVCREELWPYHPGVEDRSLTPDRTADAFTRPLGAYFRVNHRDMVAMHCAIAEVGALFATSLVHAGWEPHRIKGGRIGLSDEPLGGHAFAIVGYDREGFWIQNSWDKDWGLEGCAHVSYEDWLRNGMDVWVARLGAPVSQVSPRAMATMWTAAPQSFEAMATTELRPHIVSVGNDGLPRRSGTFGNTDAEIRDKARQALREQKKGVLLYAHGGLNDVTSAVQRVAEYRKPILDNGIWPVSFVWKSDYWTTLRNILADAIRLRRPEGLLDDAKDFLLDRLDSTLEPLARGLSGKAAWDEMKENATLASRLDGAGTPVGAAAIFLDELLEDDGADIHLVGHSAGAILLAPMIDLILKTRKDRKRAIASCTLWAPACTTAHFWKHYAAAIKGGMIGQFALFTLTDKAEQDDHCARIYNKSLLYLVSHAFEERLRIPSAPAGGGTPILGLARDIEADKELKRLLTGGNSAWIQAPNAESAEGWKSGASSHGAFDDDRETLLSTLHRVLQAATSVPAAAAAAPGKVKLGLMASERRARRHAIDAASRPDAR